MYINKITKEEIPADSIVSQNAAGLTVFDGNCWKFIPNSEIEEQTATGVSTYTVPKAVTGNTADQVIDASDVVNATLRYYLYYFGMNELTLANKTWEKNSATISDSISVYTNRSFQLTADYVMPENTSIEFSILDGVKEVPILPVGQETVTHERVFFNMPLRFKGTEIAYYKDFTYTGNTVNTLDMANDDKTYTVCYTPDESAYTYMPEHDSVQIKTILRVYPGAKQAPQINNVTLVQEGA